MGCPKDMKLFFVSEDRVKAKKVARNLEKFGRNTKIKYDYYDNKKRLRYGVFASKRKKYWR